MSGNRAVFLGFMMLTVFVWTVAIAELAAGDLVTGLIGIPVGLATFLAGATS